MSQSRFHSYKDPDSTEAFNNKLRGILESGIYLGYNVSYGGSGWNLSFTHDTDPDNAGSKLGILVTRDGVVCQENADQANVVVGYAPGAVPEMHYVCASYVYNKATPANTVNYIVKVVTPIGPAVLTDDEVLIASIYVPNGIGDYGASGVVIQNVAKKSLSGNNDKAILEFNGILKPGIYDGMEIIEGSVNAGLPNYVTLSRGTWITKENWKVEESVDQTDLFAPTNPGLNSYRFVWVIGAHKYEETDPIPDVDYFLVEGVAQSAGTEAIFPDDTAIIAVATAINPKYTSIDYLNKLGYLKIENRGGTFYTNYIRGESVLEPSTITVHSGETTSLDMKSGHYYGSEGLKQAITDVYSLLYASSALARVEKSYTILLDGEFSLSDASLYIPSCIRLKGLGSSSKIKSETDDVIKATGWKVIYDTVNATITVNSIGGGSPPVGYQRVNITINNLGSYRSGDDLVTHKFVPGDTIYLYDHTAALTYKAIFISYVTTSNNWTFYAYVETGWVTTNVDISLLVMKREMHLENFEVDRINIADGNLSVKYCEHSSVKDVRTRNYEHSIVRFSKFDGLIVTNTISHTGYFHSIFSEFNSYDNIKFIGTTSPITLGQWEYRSRIGSIQYYNDSVVMALTVYFNDSSIDLLECIGDTGSSISVHSHSCFIGSIAGANAVLDNGPNTIGFVTGNLTISATVPSIKIIHVAGVITDSSGEVSNRIYHSSTINDATNFLEHANTDRNLKITSDGDISWNAATGVLSWAGNVDFDLAYDIGINRIVAGSVILSLSGNRAYFRLVRNASGTSTVTLSTITKALTSNLRGETDIIFFAIRSGDNIYLWDGTRIESGQTVKIGSTPPPDGSVTYPKLAASALTFHNKFFRDYVIPELNTGVDNSFPFINTGTVAYTYTIGTGVIQFASNVDLSLVRAGDVFIFRNTNYGFGGAAYTREEIISVNDTANTVTLSVGLVPTIGAPSLWNGSIARGNKACLNTNLTSFTYNPTTGHCAFVPGLGFSQYQVRPGYVFVDNVGRKFRIIDRDTSGLGDWVEIEHNIRDVSDGVPTSSEGGSVETNNNPYGIQLSDLSILGGAEFIPIDGYGKLDNINIDDQVVRINSSYFSNLERLSCNPFDNRIRVWRSRSTKVALEEEINDGSPNALYFGDMSIRGIDFTGVCTGLAFVTAGLVTGTGLIGCEIDGENFSITEILRAYSLDNCYGMAINDYHLVVFPQLNRLPQGVHNIKFWLPSRCIVRGVMVFNSSHNSDNTNMVTEHVGSYVQNGGYYSTDVPTKNVIIPANPEWDKGSRIIRYINSSQVYSWATKLVRSFYSTGHISTGSPDITNVTNISNWHIGDLLMTLDTTGGNPYTKYIHRITNIAGTTITCESNIPYTDSSGNNKIYYYGASYYGAQDRVNEEIAATMSMMEFSGPGELNDNKTMASGNGVTRPHTMGIRLSDCATGLWGTDALINNNSGQLRLAALSDEVRIYFVGTGLSMGINNTDTFDYYVDGVDCGSIAVGDPIPILASRYDQDSGGCFLCGELPYGQHIVRIVGNGANVDLQSITIWQPSKPIIASGSLELWDTNVLSVPEGQWNTILPAVIDVVDGIGNIQLGTINMEVGSILFADSTAALADIGGLLGTLTTERAFICTSATNASYFLVPFYGDEITLITNWITLNAATPFEVSFLDNNGTWSGPSTLARCTCSGSSQLNTSAVTGHRTRWILSEVGFHVLRVDFMDGLNSIGLDAVEIHTPFHSYKTKQPIANDHFLPMQFAGIDKRNLVPFDSTLMAKGQITHMQGAVLNSATVDNTAQQPFVFYTRGGQTKVACSFVAENAGNTIVAVSLAIDGIEDGRTLTDTSPAVGDDHAITISRVLFLQPGMHYAYIKGATNDHVFGTHWSMENVSYITKNPVRSRGESMRGPALPGEGSF